MSMTVQPLPGCPDELATELANGRPILVIARNSTSGSSEGRRLAADDALEALRALKRQGVVDVTAIAPSSEQIMEGLRTSSEVITRTFGIWRYFRWQSPDGRVRLLVCVGSGHLVDDAGVQPHMEYVRDEIVKIKPVLLWAKAQDRLGRDGAGAMAIASALKAQHRRGLVTFVGWKGRGLMDPAEGIVDLEMVIHGRQSGEQAKQLGKNSRDAMRERTGERMIDGRVPFALHVVVPPGLGQAHKLNDKGGRGWGFAYLDADDYRPSQEEVHGPLPLALDANGQPVDQVENVRWALHELAAGRSTMEVAAELHLRNFAFMALRRRKGHTAVVRDPLHPRNPKYARSVVNSILRHLEFYTSGVLVTFIAGVEVRIEGMAPPGGWLSDADAAALMQRVNQRERRLTTALLLSGLRARFLGERVTLYARDASHDTQGKHVSDPRYRLVSDSGTPAGFSVDHDSLVASVVAGITDALTIGPVQLRLLPSLDGDSAGGAARARVDAAEQVVHRLERERDQLLRKLGREMASDDPLAPHFREDLARLTEQEWPAAMEDLEAALSEQRRLARDHAERVRRASLDNVLQLVASLRDPRSEQARRLLLDMITDFEVFSPNAQGRIRWRGQLSLSSGDRVVEVVFAGEHKERRRSAPSEQELAVRLLRGIPIAAEFEGKGANGTTRLRVDRHEIMRHAGLPAHMVWLTRVGDPSLVRAYVARFSEHPDAPSWISESGHLAAVFGDIDALAEALDRQVHDKKGLEAPDWMEARSKVETEALISAAITRSPSRPSRSLGGAKGASSRRCLLEWKGMPDGKSLLACSSCGSYRRCRLTINEPIGYVCLDCRADSTGVTYPAAMFDQYVAYPDSWTNSGVLLQRPQETPAASSRSKQSPQLARSLSQGAWEAIGGDYRAGMMLRDIIKKHGLRNTHDVYWVLAELGIPKRAAHAA